MTSKVNNESANVINFDYVGKQVRTIEQKDGSIWFAAKDLTKITGHGHIRQAVKTILDEDEKDTVILSDSLGRKKEMTIISESGLYQLIFRSNLPDAKVFRKYVTSVILPTIRKTGQFKVNGANVNMNSRIVKKYELANKMQTLKRERLFVNREIANVRFEQNKIETELFEMAVPNFDTTQLRLAI